ncbi:hypothetical protein Vretifemale_3151 [Volvox reticuliferus]|uniref:Uncharacterized protein n=1 Tax=Volvox reticuliferus TaxID=1737510 RepID=A0A8J4FFQ8_9CHLO|nr:hypothetical protein Vretifemale_3151 [Volvox reticuliferus]
MAATAHEIRRVLKMYDNSSIVPVHQAIAMLTEVTKLISEKPEAFDLTSRDAEVWAEAGGLSYSENDEFPSLVGARWLELLSKPGVVTSAGFDKDEWGALLQKLTGAVYAVGETG